MGDIYAYIKSLVENNIDESMEIIKGDVLDKNLALFYSVEFDIPELIDALVKKGTDINFKINIDRKTILANAIDHIKTDNVKLLLSLGANPNKPSFCNRSLRTMFPLEIAERAGYVDIIQLLLEYGARIY